MPTPKVSVVVPTRDRPGHVTTLRRSLAAQTLPADEFEVIFVDDGSTVETSVEGDADGLGVRVLSHSEPRGPAAARNTGWRAARAPLVAFTDDDCRAGPEWLAALVAAWNGGDQVLQGRTEPEGGWETSSSPLMRSQLVPAASGFYETCNIAYPRALLDDLGGFDESFRRPCGEDVELGHRASESGARLVFVAEALVHHAIHRDTLWGALRHRWMWTDAGRLLRLHPELRSRLVLRFFWKDTHPRLLFALGGVAHALGGRRRAPAVSVAAALPYLAHYRRLDSDAASPWLETARWLPANLVVDCGEVATMVAASIRWRTPML